MPSAYIANPPASWWKKHRSAPTPNSTNIQTGEWPFSFLCFVPGRRKEGGGKGRKKNGKKCRQIKEKGKMRTRKKIKSDVQATDYEADLKPGSIFFFGTVIFL